MGKRSRQNRQKKSQPARTAPSQNGEPLPTGSADVTARSADAPSCVSNAVALAAAGKLDYLPADIYHNERKLLLELQKANTDQHDKAILTLTAAMLGLTITFISNIAPHPPAWTMIFLALGWGGLVLSMVAMMFSFLTGQWACEHQIRLLDKHAEEGLRPSQVNRWSWWTVRLNVCSLLLFVAGIILVAIFSGINLLARQPPTKSTGNQPPAQEGSKMADSPKVPSAPPSTPSPSNPGTGHTPPSSPPVVPAAPPTPPPSKK